MRFGPCPTTGLACTLAVSAEEYIVRRRLAILAALAGIGYAASLYAQRSGSTSLTVQVLPEERLTPSQASLRFVVSADGAGDISTQTVMITAWVRALPGRRIRLTATPNVLSGPAGPLPASALHWSGSVTNAKAGGQEAICTAGSFPAAAPADLIAGWNRSGIITCAVEFSLADPRSLPAGTYAGTVMLALHSE